VRVTHRCPAPDEDQQQWDTQMRSGALPAAMSDTLDRLAAAPDTTPAAAATIAAFADWIRTRAAAGDLTDHVDVGEKVAFTACACCGLCPKCHQVGMYDRGPIQGCHDCSECQKCQECGQCACDVGEVIQYQPRCRTCVWSAAQQEARQRLAEYERRRHDADIKFAVSSSNMLHLPDCRMLARGSLKELEDLANATDQAAYAREHLPFHDAWYDDQNMIPIAPKLLTSTQAAGFRGKRCRTCGPVI
jgi:hypothetical protein